MSVDTVSYRMTTTLNADLKGLFCIELYFNSGKVVERICEVTKCEFEGLLEEIVDSGGERNNG